MKTYIVTTKKGTFQVSAFSTEDAKQKVRKENGQVLRGQHFPLDADSILKVNRIK
jgi:hypothetical protein